MASEHCGGEVCARYPHITMFCVAGAEHDEVVYLRQPVCGCVCLACSQIAESEGVRPITRKDGWPWR